MRILQITVIIFCMLLLSTSVVLAKTWYIKPDGTGDAPTIQAGIDSTAIADTVLLADGTYTGVGNRDIDYMSKAITVISESGNPDSCIINCEGAYLSPHRGFLFHLGEDSMSVLEGVTVTNGYVCGAGTGNGGGIACINASSPSIANCKFSDNTAEEYGGGMSCYESSPRVTNCTFLNNSAIIYRGYGGGMGCFYECSPTITSCTFSGNEAKIYGGGLYCYGVSCDPVVANCTFAGNTAILGGGGLYCDDASSALTITNCTFSANTVTSSSGRGGGMYCIESLPSAPGPILRHCTFSDNMTAGDGGGIYCWYSQITLINCTFSRNSGEPGGAITCWYNSSPTLSNCIIAFSERGSAIPCDVDAHPILNCCNIYSNAGGDWVGYIGGQEGISGNYSADPQFCGIQGTDNFYLQDDSPCAPGNHPDGNNCGLIGALPVACGVVAILIDNFQAKVLDNGTGVELTWDITSNEGIKGFKIYRRTEKQEVQKQLNFGGLIPSEERKYYDNSVLGAENYQYTLSVVKEDGSEIRSHAIVVRIKIYELALHQNYPNPFNPSTTISFTLSEKSNVNLSIYNIEGKLVKTLINDVLDVGYEQTTWNGTDDKGNPVSSGIYFYRLTAGNRTLTKKMVLLK